MAHCGISWRAHRGIPFLGVCLLAHCGDWISPAGFLHLLFRLDNIAMLGASRRLCAFGRGQLRLGGPAAHASRCGELVSCAELLLSFSALRGAPDRSHGCDNINVGEGILSDGSIPSGHHCYCARRTYICCQLLSGRNVVNVVQPTTQPRVVNMHYTQYLHFDPSMVRIVAQAIKTAHWLSLKSSSFQVHSAFAGIFFIAKQGLM